jgi:hypothetical protein
LFKKYNWLSLLTDPQKIGSLFSNFSSKSIVNCELLQSSSISRRANSDFPEPISPLTAIKMGVFASGLVKKSTMSSVSFGIKSFAEPTISSFCLFGILELSSSIGFICGLIKNSGFKIFLVTSAVSSVGSVGTKIGIDIDLPLNS